MARTAHRTSCTSPAKRGVPRNLKDESELYVQILLKFYSASFDTWIQLPYCGSQTGRSHNIIHQNLKFTQNLKFLSHQPEIKLWKGFLSLVLDLVYCYRTLEKLLALSDCPMEKSEEQTDIQAITRVLTVNHTHTVSLVQAPL